MNNGAKLRVDSRDREGHLAFGQTTNFPVESNFGFDLYQVVEPESAVSCTAFSTTKVRSSQSRIQYDINDLWSKVPSSTFGADPRDTLGTAIKQGLKDLNDPNRDFGIKGYYRADTGLLRVADNVRSAMVQNQSSVMVNSYWYAEWGNTPIFGKVPIGKTPVTSHSYLIVDWKVIDGETVFLIDSHQGQKRYMPFDVLEKALESYGTSTLMPSTQAVLDARTKTFYEWALDILKNALITLSKIQLGVNQLIQTNSTPMTKIQLWAKAIAQWEGDKTGVNPGNMKYTTLTKSWGATLGRPALDGGHFALFKDYQTGFTALCNFLTLGCEDQLIAFHQARTFEAFTKIYAGNPPQNYIQGVANLIGCQLDTDISTFLATS